MYRHRFSFRELYSRKTCFMRLVIILLGMLLISSCAGYKFSTTEALTQTENAIAQSAAEQMAQQAINKIAGQVGISPQQTTQVLPMFVQYYKGVSTAIKSNTGTQGALKSLKDTFLKQIGTVLTPAQVQQVKALI